MLFEILISTYNGEEFIKMQLESIINQSYKNWKLCIADDFSSDQTLKIIQEYSNKDKRITFYKNKKRLGPLISFYKLLKKSNSDYVIFCDQDDIWVPDKLERLFQYIYKSQKKIVFGVHNGKFLVRDKTFLKFQNRYIKNKEIIFTKKPNLSFINLLFSNKVIGCMSFGNCKLLKKIITKRPPINKGIFLDYWIALNVSLKYEIDFIDEYLINYRRHSNTTTLSKRSLFEIIKTRFIIIKFLFLDS